LISDEERRALVDAVEMRRRDPTYESRLREIIDRDRDLLDRLSE
jgi:hypothetical protein